MADGEGDRQDHTPELGIRRVAIGKADMRLVADHAIYTAEVRDGRRVQTFKRAN